MTDGAYPDLSDVWRQWLRHWEDMSNSLGVDALKTPEFGQAMNRATSLSMAAQGMLAQTFSKYLAALNLPTRADITAVAERLTALEGRIDEIHLMVSDRRAGEGPSDRSIKPTRNRRPPSAGETIKPERS